MGDSLINVNGLEFLWKQRGKKDYNLKGLIHNGAFIQYMIFEDIRNYKKVLGKIVTSPKEGEAYHWPRLQHENLAPLVDIVSINETISVYISPFVGCNLRSVVHDVRFMNLSDCFDRKKAYAEDILWALDYLHDKCLCLMNLSDVNVYVCDASDKAVICDFSCIVLAERVTKDKICVPILYQAPEINEAYFDPIAFEMWTCGVVMLQIFTRHVLPSAFIGDEVQQVLKSVKEINYNILKETNPGSDFDLLIIEELRNFLDLFLVVNPKCRVNAKNAAISTFFKKSGRRSEDICHKRNLLETGRDFGYPWPSYQIKNDKSHLENKANFTAFKDIYLDEAAKCREKLKKVPSTNKFINLVQDRESIFKNIKKDKYNKTCILSDDKKDLEAGLTENGQNKNFRKEKKKMCITDMGDIIHNIPLRPEVYSSTLNKQLKVTNLKENTKPSEETKTEDKKENNEMKSSNFPNYHKIQNDGSLNYEDESCVFINDCEDKSKPQSLLHMKISADSLELCLDAENDEATLNEDIDSENAENVCSEMLNVVDNKQNLELGIWNTDQQYPNFNEGPYGTASNCATSKSTENCSLSRNDHLLSNNFAANSSRSDPCINRFKGRKNNDDGLSPPNSLSNNVISNNNLKMIFDSDRIDNNNATCYDWHSYGIMIPEEQRNMLTITSKIEDSISRPEDKQIKLKDGNFFAEGCPHTSCHDLLTKLDSTEEQGRKSCSEPDGNYITADDSVRHEDLIDHESVCTQNSQTGIKIKKYRSNSYKQAILRGIIDTESTETDGVAKARDSLERRRKVLPKCSFSDNHGFKCTDVSKIDGVAENDENEPVDVSRNTDTERVTFSSSILGSKLITLDSGGSSSTKRIKKRCKRRIRKRWYHYLCPGSRTENEADLTPEIIRYSKKP